MLTDAEAARVPDLASRGWLHVWDDRVAVTDDGRLLADAAVRELLG